MRPIDADALLQKIKDGVWIQVEDGCGNAIGREKLNPNFAFIINEMPTIDAQPIRYEKWIETVVRGTPSIYCSMCSSESPVYYPLNFCSNCGAEMDGDKDG